MISYILYSIFYGKNHDSDAIILVSFHCFSAESVCKPEEWQIILGKTINFFKDGIPDFFTKSIPDLFVDKIGGGVVDVTRDVGDFFKDKIGGGIIDVGKKIGDGTKITAFGFQ